MKVLGALLLAVTLFAGAAFAQGKKDYPLQVQMGDITERTWAAMSYSWWASATINGVTYDAKCEAKLCSHALVAGTYAARLEGDNLYVYGETSDGKGKVVHFKIKRGGAAHGTMHPAGNPASN
jgi:hypothetical protein